MKCVPIEQMTEKQCANCKITKPINEFSIRNEKRKNGITARPRSKCKICECEKAKNYSSQPHIRKKLNDYKKVLRHTDIKYWIQNRIASWRIKTKDSDLTVDYLLDLYNKQNASCYYTGVPLEFSKTNGVDFDALSLDKLDPDLGYIKGNVAFCTYRVNTMKGNLT